MKTIFNAPSIFVYFVLKPTQTKLRTPKVSDDVRLWGLWLWTFRNDSQIGIFVQSPKTEFSVAAHITYVVKYLLIKIATIQAGLAELSCAESYHFAWSDAGLHWSSRCSSTPCWKRFYFCACDFKKYLRHLKRIPNSNHNWDGLTSYIFIKTLHFLVCLYSCKLICFS